jgi:serine protease
MPNGRVLPSRPHLARTSAWLLAGAVALVACGSDDAPAGSLSLPVDSSVVPAQAMIGDRPVGRMMSESGVATDFFLGELILVTDDRAKVEAFAARWGGEIVESTERASGTPAMHKVKLDPSTAAVERLVSDLNARAPELRGTFRSSSDEAAKLLAVALAEASSQGITVMPNFVMAPQAIEDGTTTEAPTGDAPLYSTNAFDWPYMSRGSAQDIGVGAAWQAMARAGVFRHKVKMMILDGGFSPSADFPARRTVLGDWNVPNPGTCGGRPCPWHGTNVVNVAMGTGDDERGTVGPAAPVAELIAVPMQLEFFQLLTTIERILVGSAAADIINVSAGFEIDIGFDVAVKIACLGTCPSPTEMASGLMATMLASNKLLFASAGNAGKNVDGRSNPEGSTFVPCELAGVICVGGMDHDSTALARTAGGGSNFGSKSDDDSVDIYGPYWTWVGSDPDNPANHARLRPGTSYSSPFVAGVAALVWASDPSQSASQVWNVIRDTAHLGGVHDEGGHQRRINAFGAVARVLGGAPPMVTLTPTISTAPLNREFSLTAQVTDDGALCPPNRCPLTWNPRPSRVHGSTAFYRFDSVGRKVVTVTAEDPVGQTQAASQRVDVVNAAPRVAISAPAPGATVPQGLALQLLGSATDDNVGPGPDPGSLSCAWTSSNPADPFPATGCNIVRTFATPGARTLTLSATDPEGQRSTASVAITVTPPPENYPPTAVSTTTLPALTYAGKGYSWDTPLALSATATDPEGEPLTYEWRATSYRPNSATPYATNVILSTSESFTWTPSTTASLFGTSQELGVACYDGQIVRISVRARDTESFSQPVTLPDVRIYRCMLD